MEGIGGFGDAGPANPEHDREKIVRERELVAPDAIRRHRKPARAALQYRMFDVARDKLLRAEERGADVVSHQSRKRAALAHAPIEVCDRHPPDAPANLTECRSRGNGRIERSIGFDEPLTSDGADFDAIAVEEQGNYGEDGVDRKIDVCDRAPHRMRELMRCKRNDVEILLDAGEIDGRKRIEHAVAGGEYRGGHLGAKNDLESAESATTGPGVALMISPSRLVTNDGFYRTIARRTGKVRLRTHPLRASERCGRNPTSVVAVQLVVTTNANALFTPFDLLGKTLRNRIVMAPLTRNRATHGTDVPHALNAEYYAQRASAGLIISEATQISPTGKGYAFTPGIYSDDQVAGWKLVTAAVHAQGGTIVLQLWHVGRFSHPALQPGGVLPVGPSAIAPVGQKTFIEDGSFVDVGTPRALETRELPGIVADYVRATKNALAAGFDGVEIHGANGYLLDQFLRNGANQRTDAYGGSVENRMRFPLEVVDAIVAAVGAQRVGIRLSPVSPASGLSDSDPAAVFFPFVRELSKRALAYVHVVEGATGGPRDATPFDFHALRKEFTGPWMVNNGYNREMAVDAVASGYADLVAFGKAFIANPDLVERLRVDATLNALDADHLYGGGAEGYTDYPTLEAVAR
jgi:N-ethylmaleimide reductase